MITEENKCVDGMELRGRVYYMRMRVPKRFAEVEQRKEVNLSLGTRSYEEAQARLVLKKRALEKQWESDLINNSDPMTFDAYSSAMALLDNIGVSYRPMKDLVEGPLSELLDRIEQIGSNISSSQIPALLGGLELPTIKISEMPPVVFEVRSEEIAAKNRAQLRTWKGKYHRAAASMVSLVGDKAVPDLSEEDAETYWRYWRGRWKDGDVSVNYAQKMLRFMKQTVDAYFEKVGIPDSKKKNPFANLRIGSSGSKHASEPKKLALPVAWVRDVVINQSGTETLNSEARDIMTIVAETGSRQREIYDVPADDIHLDSKIPHIMVQCRDDGDSKRDIKNQASKRPIILEGAALEAMRRNPTGFPRYRGTDSYSATVNNYLRDAKIFPVSPKLGESYTIGCTRHTFEDRMKAAGMTNEERAYLMGHSVGSIRGRPTYGSEPDLEMRALLQEMVSFPTKVWKPRPIAVLRSEISKLLESEGFRVNR